jgi:hypothetical protein
MMSGLTVANFHDASSLLPILTSAIIIDVAVLFLVIFGWIKSRAVQEWYHKYGIAAVAADVLSIVIGIVLARFVYTTFFAKASLATFCGLAVAIQVIHDVLFAQFFYAVPRGKSAILDTFKDYATENGPGIILFDAGMIVATVLVAQLLVSFSLNINLICLIVILYILPYALYSIPRK